ncbi:hypothetical protein [Asticcacaulis sp. YBE204]|uniref:hypothetical protein n=1 Tax=Asticcacaulis sp. YBE204 TaxID=1282363 RepID=UPI0003C3EA3C|nr:hypothetical protein [Asticcacaulis sp. YBE204]ESQ79080.1 hypothetical protein AEYBE204_11690 [Asticcacaulis sp. YBE204]
MAMFQTEHDIPPRDTGSQTLLVLVALAVIIVVSVAVALLIPDPRTEPRPVDVLAQQSSQTSPSSN